MVVFVIVGWGAHTHTHTPFLGPSPTHPPWGCAVQADLSHLVLEDELAHRSHFIALRGSKVPCILRLPVGQLLPTWSSGLPVCLCAGGRHCARKDDRHCILLASQPASPHCRNRVLWLLLSPCQSGGDVRRGCAGTVVVFFSSPEFCGTCFCFCATQSSLAYAMHHSRPLRTPCITLRSNPPPVVLAFQCATMWFDQSKLELRVAFDGVRRQPRTGILRCRKADIKRYSQCTHHMWSLLPT